MSEFLGEDRSWHCNREIEADKIFTDRSRCWNIAGGKFLDEHHYSVAAKLIVAAAVLLSLSVAVILSMFPIEGRPGVQIAMKKLIVGTTLISGVLITSLLVGSAINNWKISAAIDFVSEIEPALDDYRDRTGEFPERLSAIGVTDQPALFKQSIGYELDGTGYRFKFRGPSGFARWHYYFSDTRQWEDTD